MRLSITGTPRRIARLARNTPVLLRVITGTVRVADGAEPLFSGEGIPISASDGVQNWLMPEGEIWVCADAPAPASLEAIIP